MDKYAEHLGDYAFYFMGSKDLAEEVVADVFINLWKIKNSLQIRTSLRAYLYRSCKNRALDLLEKEKKHQAENIEGNDVVQDNYLPDAAIKIKELNWQIDALIRGMPHQKQLIFRMSRIDGLKYSEIADILSISINTVQNHMVAAVKFMANHRIDLE